MKNKLPLILALALLALTAAISLDLLPASLTAGGSLLAFGLGVPLMLRAPEQDPSGGGGGAGDPEPGATIGQQLRAALSAKASLVGKIDEQRAALADMTKQLELGAADLVAAQGEIAKLTEKITALEASLAKAGEDLKAAEAANAKLLLEAKTSDDLANERLAALGFPARDLPKADGDKPGDTADELLAAAEKETDPRRKGELAAQAWNAAFPQAGGKN